MERITGRVSDAVLHEKRHSAKRPIWQRIGLGGGPRFLEQRMNHRIQLGVHALDALDGGIDQLDRRDLLRADQIRLPDGIDPRQVTGHRRRLSSALMGIDKSKVDALLARRTVARSTTGCCRRASRRWRYEGEIVAFETFGDATPDTRYAMFSSTKAFVASAVWQLIGRGPGRPVRSGSSTTSPSSAPTARTSSPSSR